MRKNYYMIVLFLFVCLASISGNPITVNQAQEIAAKFFGSTPGLRNASGVKLMYQPVQTRSGGDAEYFIFVPEANQGFVVVSGDDVLPPVVGYSLEAPASRDKIPEALVAWLGEYARYVRDVRVGKVKAAQVSSTGSEVAPLIETKWNQDMPFSNLCPGQYPSGCVATSIAQIMKYHKWPEQGVGVLENNGFSIDLSTYKYDWENMLDVYPKRWNEDANKYEPDGFTETQASAVATLMRDCGYSVNMFYKESESTASTERLVRALRTNFKYAPTVAYYSRALYTTDTWTRIIREELQAGRPVNYSGSSASGAGHSFVCDGIDANNFLHINWGWGGFCDGYFDMNILSPDGIGIGGGDGAYFCEQGIVAGIRPIAPEDDNLKVDEHLNVIGLNFGLSDKRIFIGMSRLSNPTSESREVRPALVWLNEDGSVDRIMNIQYNNTFPVLRCGYFFRDLNGFVNIPYDSGTHRFIVANKIEEGYETYSMGEFMDGGTVTIDDAGLVTFQPNHSDMFPAVNLLSITQPVTGFTDSPVLFHVKFKNKGDAPLDKPLYLAVVPEAKDNGTLVDYAAYVNLGSLYQPAYAVTASIYGQAELELDYATWEQALPGRYRIHFCERVNVGENTEYHAIPEEAPQYINIQQLPDYPIITLKEKIELWSEKYKQENYVVVGATIFPTATKDYTGRMELWVSKIGDDPAQESCIVSKEVNVRKNNTSSFDLDDLSSVLVTLEEGTYNAYLKYEVEGKMCRIEGDDNLDTFILEPADTPQLYLNAPMVINHGEAVPLGSMVEVRFSVTSRMAFTGSIRLDTFEEFGGEWINVLGNNQYLPVSLAAGETKVMKVNCVVTSKVLPFMTYQLSGTYYQENGDYMGSLGYGIYQESIRFNLMAAPASKRPKLVSELSINRGTPIPQGSKGEVKATILSDAGFSGKMYLDCISWDGKKVLLGAPVSVDLTAGMQKEVTLPYDCVPDVNPGYYNLHIYCEYTDQSGAYELDYDAYVGSTGFSVDVSTGVDDGVVSQFSLLSQPGAFLLKGAAENSRVQVSGLNGRVLFNGIVAGPEFRIPMENVSAGMYIVTVETPDKKKISLKGVLR